MDACARHGCNHWFPVGLRAMTKFTLMVLTIGDLEYNSSVKNGTAPFPEVKT